MRALPGQPIPLYLQWVRGDPDVLVRQFPRYRTDEIIKSESSNTWIPAFRFPDQSYGHDRITYSPLYASKPLDVPGVDVATFVGVIRA